MPQLCLRARAFSTAAKALERSEPYLNQRPINMRGLLLGESCLDFLTRKIPSKSRDYWNAELNNGHVKRLGVALSSEDKLRSGDTLLHTLLESAEPAVSTDIEVLHEDHNLFVVNKPAPLPVHPCGRYRFHTFTEIAKQAWPDLNLHLVHRLDAETTGVLILAKNPETARHLTELFSNRLVQKEYLALVEPAPSWDELSCNTPIVNHKHPGGQPATTELICLHRSDQQAIILAKPITGRTNQIRVHLRALGHPVLHLHAWKLVLFNQT